MKAATLESKFPLLAVENGCIVSKEADVTVAFRVELPELFSVTGSEYEAVHSAWHKAVKVLPEYSIVHKQDFFIEEKYRPETDRDDLSFLSRSFERHFNERPFLNHFCYLFLTKTTKARSRQESTFSTLCKGRLVPKEIEDRETVTRFLEAVGQFEKIMNDSGFVTLRRLTTDEITGTERSAGIVEKYLSLSQHDTTVLKDIQLNPEEMRIGDDILCLHTLSDTEDLPGKVATDSRYERLSTDRSDCRLSFAAPVGLLLDCNHCYNQYIFIDDHGENLKRFEQTARNMHSLSRYSRSNQINKAWIEEYLNEAHSKGLTSVRCHCNVMAWSDDREELRRIKNEVGSQLALMECKPRHNTVDVPTLFWAAIPGNEGHELMQVKNIQAKVKKTRMTIPILGMTAKQQKSGGWEGTGTMTVYYVSSLFRRVMADYMKNGVDTYFELLLTNEDPTGDAGRQTVLLKDVNIEEMLIGKIDVEEAAMEEEMKFTFGGVELLDKFNQM